MKKTLFGIVILTPALLCVTPAAAAPITGVANIAGNVNVSGAAVAFSPTFITGSGLETGSFAGITGGTIQSLTGGAFTGPTNVPNFITFTGGTAPVVFDLTFISPGVGTVAGCSSSALGARCTPAGSPFTLFQLSSNTVIATLQLNGNAYTGSPSTGTTQVNSIFSTQSVLFGSLPGIYNRFQNGGELTGITYSASFATVADNAVPEPATLGLASLALVGLGLLARRK